MGEPKVEWLPPSPGVRAWESAETSQMRVVVMPNPEGRRPCVDIMEMYQSWRDMNVATIPAEDLPWLIQALQEALPKLAERGEVGA